MNQDRRDIRPSGESDPLVAARYRASATERTPPPLDAAVLRVARAALGDMRFRGLTAYWLRPFAFIATLALSLALLLELTSIQNPRPEVASEAESPAAEPAASYPTRVGGDDVAGSRTDTVTPAPLVQRDAADAKAQMQQMRKDAGHRLRSEKASAMTGEAEATPAPPSETVPAGDDQASSGFAEMVEASSRQMQERSSVVENAIQNINQTQPTSSPPAGKMSALPAPANMPNSVARFCSEEQIIDADRWWQCIADLRDAGQIDQADTEQDLFDAAHPEFEPTQAR